MSVEPCACVQKMLYEGTGSSFDARVYCNRHRLFARKGEDGTVIASRDPFKRDLGGNWIDVAGLSRRSVR